MGAVVQPKGQPTRTKPYLPTTKRKMVFYWNTAWSMNNLDPGERWLWNVSLNYFTIVQLGLFCQRSGKWGEIPYMQAFMSLHNSDSDENEEGTKLIFQREDVIKDQEWKKRDEEEAALQSPSKARPSPSAPRT